MPSSVNGDIINHNYFSISYIEEYKIPEWTIYFSTKSRLEGYKYPRTSNFINDPMYKSGSAKFIDYRGSGFDRGHMVPSKDMSFDSVALRE